MRIIASGTLKAYGRTHRDAQKPLELWARAVLVAQWQSLEDVRKTYPHADACRAHSGATVTVFNIKGNAYRLVVAIHYATQIVFIRDFMTHAQYSKDA